MPSLQPSLAPQAPVAPKKGGALGRGVSPVSSSRALVAHKPVPGGDVDPDGAAWPPKTEAPLSARSAASAGTGGVPASVPALRLLHGVFPPVLDVFGRTRSAPVLFCGDKVRALRAGATIGRAHVFVWRVQCCSVRVCATSRAEFVRGAAPVCRTPWRS
jgi:hypothetical protein